ncbi:MAG: 3-deoxy-D-manno-octulosonic acid transferase [Lentisphaerae bacterium]|nr:3-deoxy-D-manno-octulosonic acid transferase [Lentisphaerota bacterium]
MRILLFFYNLILPLGFIFFLPGLLWKLWRRPGWKKTFSERFGCFSRQRKKELTAYQNGIWIHAVSVGESVIALALSRKLRQRYPNLPIVISTGTTTGQDLVRKQLPEGVAAIFCPMDFLWMVCRTLRLIKPRMLVIFETEIWPNLIVQAQKLQIKTALVNARLSDHSAKGYMRFKFFFGPLLAKFDLIAAQGAGDQERFQKVSPQANVVNCGNLKFDQSVPGDLQAVDLSEVFGTTASPVLLGASTHPGEEAVIAASFLELRKSIESLRLVLIPRHAERGGEVAEMLKKLNIPLLRRSSGEQIGEGNTLCLLADTTGEMLKFMKSADVVIMGKSLAGHDEGHNLIEPALLKKAIVTGHKLRNFRFLLQVLTQKNAVKTVADDSELTPALLELLQNEQLRSNLGNAAYEAINEHAGASAKTIEALDKLLQ